MPGYVSITFIWTTFLTFALFIYAIRQTIFESIVGNILIFLIPFCIVFQSVPALSGFYLSAATSLFRHISRIHIVFSPGKFMAIIN